MRKDRIKRVLKHKYVHPKTSNGRLQWVPIVVKNKDYLIGSISAVQNFGSMVGLMISDWPSLLSSERFTDVVSCDRRFSTMTNAERMVFVKEIVTESETRNSQEHLNGESLNEYIFSISCNCGNFVGFKDTSEIPKDGLVCSVCGRVLIDYTHKNDDSFIYDGKEVNYGEYLERAKEELGIIDEEEYDEDDNDGDF